jgi:hypothetical protein
VEADFSNLKGYSYLKRIFIPEKLNKNKVLNAIKELTKNKAPGLNGIPNKVIK